MEKSQPDLSPTSSTSTEHRRPAHGSANKMSVQVQIPASMKNVQVMNECASDDKNEYELRSVQDVNECAEGVKTECDLNSMKECMQKDSLSENLLISDNTKSKDPHSVSISKSKSTNENRPKCRVKYRVIKSSGGKFSLSAANGDPDSLTKSEVKSNEKSSTVKANLEYFKNLEKSISTPVSSSTSICKMTPGKRKLAPVVVGEVTPVGISDKTISIFKPLERIYESPAKKQRSVSRVHGQSN